MKKFTLFVIMSVLGLALTAQTVEKTYYFDNPQITEIRGYQQVMFNGTMQSALHGQPSLPYFSVSLLLPQGAEAESIDVELSDFQEIGEGVELFPYQPSRTMSDNAPRKLVKDEAVYSSKGIYPAENHGAVTTQYLNGFGFAFSSFTPVQYIPSTGKLMFARTATVRVKLAAERTDHSAMLWNTDAITNKVSKLAQNPEMMETYQTRGRDVTAYDLLIITSDEYVAGYEEYCAYYNSIGLRNRIASVSDIYSSMTGVDNPEKIRNYIIQEYQNNGIMMVVLGGDVNIVPFRGFYCDVLSQGQHYTDEAIPSDLYFSGLDGTWNDNGNNRWGEIGEDDLLPEIGISRMSFDNSTELNNMINKTLMYQQQPILGEFQKVVLAGEHLNDNPVSNGSDYLELLIGTRDDNGYTTTGYPEDYNFTRLYEEQNTWSPNALKQAINAGTSYVHHDGHANSSYVAGWYGVSNSDFSGANGVDHNFTFFHSQGCDCGAFDEECILEKMVTIQNFAVAVIGNSRYGWFNEGQTEGPGAHLEREMTDAQFNDRIQFLGCALSDGRCETAPWVTAPGQWEEGALRWNFYDINVLGDGAVSVWTDEPFNAQVSCPTQLVIGTSTFDVEIADANGNPLENYRCLLYMGDDVLAMGTTDANGVAHINVDGGISNVGTLTLKVMGMNAWPISTEIMAVPSDTPYVIYDSYELANGASQIDFATNNAFNMVFKNVGSVATNNVTASISCDSEYITFDENTATIGQISGNQSVTLQNVFAFSVADNVPNNELIRFNISCTDGNNTWESNFNARVNAPEFSLVSVVLEGESGDVVNPGESAVLHFTLVNNGGASVPSAVFSVFNSHPEIVSEQSVWHLDAIAAGQEYTIDYAFTLSADAQSGVMYELPFASYYGSYEYIESYLLTVGMLMEGFETGDFSAFDWQHTSPVTAWSVVTENPYEGMYCAKSSSIDDNAATSLMITVDLVRDSQISFYYKVSSESGYDKLHFYVGNSELGSWSGEKDWTYVSYTVPAGSNTLKWSYTKDISSTSGSDCAWIDNVIFPPTAIIMGVETSVEQNVNVYPNPATDVINVELGENESDIVVYNSLGQVVKRLERMSGTVQINISDLNAGMYFVKTNGMTEKVVVK